MQPGRRPSRRAQSALLRVTARQNGAPEVGDKPGQDGLLRVARPFPVAYLPAHDSRTASPRVDALGGLGA